MYSMRHTRSAQRALSYPAPPDRDAELGNAYLHYFDRKLQHESLKLLPGEFYVTDKDIVLVTVLGSCIACCLFDLERGIGGMNHFMLPESKLETPNSEAARYGTFAMELLINGMMKRGADRKALRAKIFGGGNVLRNITSINIGPANTQFVKTYLQREQIPVLAQDVLGEAPRKIHFYAKSGRVLVHKLPVVETTAVLKQETLYNSRLHQQQPAGDVELFS